MTPDLAAAVAAADPALVLPEGGRRAHVDVPGPLALERALDLGDARAVGVVASADGARWTVPLISDGAGVRRARAGDGVAERLVSRLASGGSDSDGFLLTTFAAVPVQGERAIDVDQTNESVIVGGRAVVKWCVRLPRDGEPGSPAARRISALAAGGFHGMPEPWGLLEADGREPALVAVVVELLPGAQDGWDWAVDDVRRLARGELAIDEALDAVRAIAASIARMHLALAAAGRSTATTADAEAWADRARSELMEALALVGGDEGARLRERADRIDAAYGALAHASGGPLIDIHGDLHVGQVLRSTSGYAITDFDGNPVATAEERAARQPAAVDVAGMTASLDHVGRVVLFRTPGVDEAVVRDWIAQAQSVFVDVYRTSLRSGGAPELLDDRLLLPLRIAQEVREHLYAARHLPHWVYVPDMALADLLP